MRLGVPLWLFNKFVLKRRAQVLSRYLETMKPGPTDTCLEIGGPTNAMSELTDKFSRYLVANLDADYLNINRTYYSRPYHSIVADGCHLPIKDGGIDFVFANALLEHIPREQRHIFASEIKRVCRKGYFLANNNHWFPLDPHYHVPFYQFLPHSLKRFVSGYVSFKWIPRGTYIQIDLLTIKEYRNLFPGAEYEGLRFPFSLVAESILVWQRYD